MVIAAFVIVFFAGFAGGWALFKHRQGLIDKAQAEIRQAASKLGG